MKLLPALLMCLLTASSPCEKISLPIQSLELPNGMKVFLVERPMAPVFSACLIFKAGSVDDPLGASGMAHFCEHLYFKGTKSYGLKRGEDYAKEESLLKALDLLDENIIAERQSLKEASRRQGLATGKAGSETSKTLEKAEQEFQALQVKLRAMVAPNEVGNLYEAAGGVNLDGATGTDYTQYGISLPKSRFELFCRIEADRMAQPVLREFYTEREVVKEERRMLLEGDEGDQGQAGSLTEPFLAAAFPYHAYGRMTIGEMSDINHISRSAAQAFLSRHYAPNRCALVLVGDLTLTETAPFLNAYFGKIPRQPAPPLSHTQVPVQRGERRITVEKNVTSRLKVGWRIPEQEHPDAPVLLVLADLLSGGRTSRLYKKAVLEKQLTGAFDAWYGEPGCKFPNLFVAAAVAMGSHGTAELEQVLYDELEQLKKESPAPEELFRITRNNEMRLMKKLEDAKSLAAEIGASWALTEDPAAFLREVERMKAVKPSDIPRVVEKYFTRQNRVVGILQQAEKTEKQTAKENR